MAHEWGGVTGWDPADKTLRELYWGLLGRRRDEWDRTSQVLSFIAAHAGKRVPADRLHPYRKAGGGRKGRVAGFFGAVRSALAGKRKKAGKGPQAITE